MYSSLIKAICVMTLFVMTPVAVFMDESVRYGVKESSSEEYEEAYEIDDSDDYESSADRGDDYRLEDADPEEIDVEEISLGCIGHDGSKSTTSFEVENCSDYDLCEELVKCSVAEDEPQTQCVREAAIDICSIDADAVMELNRDERQNQYMETISSSEVIKFETKEVVYGEDRVWLSAKVHNPTGAHITQAGFNATTPTGAHAGDETVFLDTTEEEFEIEFSLEGFSEAVLMGSEFEYSFFVISDGEKFRSRENSFSFPLD